MHKSSLDLMGKLIARVRPRLPGNRVLDVGALDVNGTYRELCEKYDLVYTGCDQEEGPNVDLVRAASDLAWPDYEYDLVISGQMLEHDPRPHESVAGMRNVVKRDGWIILIAPFRWGVHRYPIDCWRFLPDGMRVLLEGMAEIRAEIVKDDCYGMGRQP